MSQYRDFENYQAPPLASPAPAKAERGCLFYGLIGCGILLLVSLILAGVGSFLAYKYGKSFVTDVAVKAINEGIEDSDLPAEEKVAIKAEIQQIGDDFKGGKITLEQMGAMIEGIAQGPIGPYIMCRVLEISYLERSGLSQDEKTAAKRTLNRVMRGVIEGSIQSSELEPIGRKIMKNADSKNPKLKEKLTDEELRAFLAECKQLADEKKVPDEDFKVELSKELRRIAEAVRNGQPIQPERDNAELGAPDTENKETETEAESADALDSTSDPKKDAENE